MAVITRVEVALPGGGAESLPVTRLISIGVVKMPRCVVRLCDLPVCPHSVHLAVMNPESRVARGGEEITTRVTTETD